MTTTLPATLRRKSWHVPEFAIVLAVSIAGLIISLTLSGATWTDATIVGP